MPYYIVTYKESIKKPDEEAYIRTEYSDFFQREVEWKDLIKNLLFRYPGFNIIYDVEPISELSIPKNSKIIEL